MLKIINRHLDPFICSQHFEFVATSLDKILIYSYITHGCVIALILVQILTYS
jgi:hypothetical protein